MKLPFFNQNKIEYFAKNDQNSRRNKILLIVLAAIFILAIIAMAILSLPSESQREQQKLSNQIKDSMQGSQNNSNITINNAKQSGNFVSASVGDQNSSSVIFYKKNPDGALSQVAVQQNYNPIALLQLGMTIDNISGLTNLSSDEVRKSVSAQCGYAGGDNPGFYAMNQVSSDWSQSVNDKRVVDVQSRLAHYISERNKNFAKDDKIICAVGVANSATLHIEPSTFNNITDFQVQFIAYSGSISSHNASLIMTPNYQFSLILDDQKI